ncbi:glycosyltransferase [Anaerobranca gottschalkii]|uniref:Processive 1,2-diacylglycerol beta-glucosyltransferase n=1 Tax=Anaerobranca gottschalkii DSM 13577 TaxID=1120990 RepID=A0A1I0CII5_9FIRM|nr:glycosyltransferase [Anaerobranca gottschalkii]SET18783.1 processive 1,2-diacylglycerol beta-glucosyltransferase [Anaerobranca gottschalkii DSM 13577]
MGKIVLLSEPFGSGHTRAAESLAKGLKELDVELTPIVLEPGLKSYPRLFKNICNLYNSILRHSPNLWGYTYESQREKDLGKIYAGLFKLQEWLKSSYVDLLLDAVEGSTIVVCTHPLPLQGMAYLKRMGWEGKLAAFITDYDFHWAWFNPAVDKYFFSGELNIKSIPFNLTEKLVPVPIPVDTDFWNPLPKDIAKEKLMLKGEEVVLVMGGGWGLGIDFKLIEQLIKLEGNDKREIIIITGINKKLHDKFQKYVQQYKLDNITIKGFVKNIQDYMCASDLLITKPGALTCAEALTLGLPTILINPIPGQEQRNCQYLSNKYPTMKYLDDYSQLPFYIQSLRNPLFTPTDPTLASKELLKFIKVG